MNLDKETTFEKLAKIEQSFMNLPEIQQGANIYQNKFHEFDVYDHIKAVVEEIKRKAGGQPSPELLVAGILHDIAKPIVASDKLDEAGNRLTDKNGNYYHEFTNHEIEGVGIIEKMDNDYFNHYSLDKQKITLLVREHYTPMKYIKRMRKAEDFEEFKQIFGELKQYLMNVMGDAYDDLVLLFYCDSLGKGSNVPDQQELEFFYRLLKTNDKDSEKELLQETYIKQSTMFNPNRE